VLFDTWQPRRHLHPCCECCDLLAIKQEVCSTHDLMHEDGNVIKQQIRSCSPTGLGQPVVKLHEAAFNPSNLSVHTGRTLDPLTDSQVSLYCCATFEPSLLCSQSMMLSSLNACAELYHTAFLAASTQVRAGTAG
jgi:hypothetical protein